MPGTRGLDVLADLRREEPHARVVMVTKSEEDRTMVEAIGRRVDEYLVKPASPRQVLSVVTRLLEGHQIQQQRAAQEFAARFSGLSQAREDARDWRQFLALYDKQNKKNNKQQNTNKKKQQNKNPKNNHNKKKKKRTKRKKKTRC